MSNANATLLTLLMPLFYQPVLKQSLLWLGYFFCHLNRLFFMTLILGLKTLNSTPPGGDTGLFPWWDKFTFEEAEEVLMNNWDASDTIVRQLDSWFHPHPTGRRGHMEQREQMVCRRRNLLCNTCEGTPEEHVIDVFLRCNASGLYKILLFYIFYMTGVMDDCPLFRPDLYWLPQSSAWALTRC